MLDRDQRQLIQANRNLIQAAHLGDVKTVRELLRQGAEINQTNEYGETALMGASRSDSFETVCELLHQRAAINIADSDGYTALMRAAANGKLANVRELLRQGAEINQVTKKGDTALIIAAFCGYLEVVQELVHQGAAINHANNAGRTALFEATRRGHETVFNFINEALAYPEKKKKIVSVFNFFAEKGINIPEVLVDMFTDYARPDGLPAPPRKNKS